MKKLITSVLLACVCVGCDRPVLANSPEAPSAGPTVVDTLKKLELDLGDAMVTVDIDELNQILAESIGTSGKVCSILPSR